MPSVTAYTLVETSKHKSTAGWGTHNNVGLVAKFPMADIIALRLGICNPRSCRIPHVIVAIIAARLVYAIIVHDYIWVGA